mgnify:CR=1 FL=1
MSAARHRSHPSFPRKETRTSHFTSSLRHIRHGVDSPGVPSARTLSTTMRRTCLWARDRIRSAGTPFRSNSRHVFSRSRRSAHMVGLFCTAVLLVDAVTVFDRLVWFFTPSFRANSSVLVHRERRHWNLSWLLPCHAFGVVCAVCDVFVCVCVCSCACEDCLTTPINANNHQNASAFGRQREPTALCVWCDNARRAS